MTRTITFEHPVDQYEDLDQLDNINHIITELLGEVFIDWRDEHTVEVSIE